MSNWIAISPRWVPRGSALVLGIAFALTLIGAFQPSAAAADLRRHLALRSSTPAADATAASNVEEVRLFFTEAPQISGTSVRVMDTAEKLVPTTEAATDGEDPTQVLVHIESPLAPGAYVVAWRALAQDGHAVNGEFSFTVTAE